MSEELIDEILLKYRTVAVVGLSKDEGKDSHRVASFLQKRGFRIIPVNPTADSILGEKAYPSLGAIPEELRRQVEIVDIFRPSKDVPAIVDEALSIRREGGNPKVIWMQLGITSSGAASIAEEAGMKVVQDRCMMVEAGSRSEMLDFSRLPEEGQG